LNEITPPGQLNHSASIRSVSNMSSSSEIGIAIPLNVWQDPQGNVVLRYSREECVIYFGCWTDAGIPADYIGQVTFHNAWAVRGLCLEWHGYKIAETHYHSSILSVENSKWLSQLSEQRLTLYPNWKQWDTREYLHYVVSGHDNYYDVVATGFEESIVPESEAGELAALIHEA
jgi:hypothetical protein